MGALGFGFMGLISGLLEPKSIKIGAIITDFEPIRKYAMNDTTHPASSDATTHFGFNTVAESEKEAKVAEVFHSVAKKYDIMNDVMSGGLHRIWKMVTINRVAPRPGMKILDLASGTADLAIAFAKKVGDSGQVWATDINESMLRVGRDRLIDKGVLAPVALANAEHLPFPDNYFDVVTVAFGLRNMTHKDKALKEMLRVLRPGGRVFVLEFSKVAPPLQKAYDFYSFNILPKMGQLIANDSASYQYLAESIRMHPDQETLKAIMVDAGFDFVQYHNMTAGLVALHEGVKL
jgi:demethylmenaquinone methyltransferase/2-methoxy-6-polyprenyl-1,4-benzoquinol methylase